MCRGEQTESGFSHIKSPLKPKAETKTFSRRDINLLHTKCQVRLFKEQQGNIGQKLTVSFRKKSTEGGTSERQWKVPFI